MTVSEVGPGFSMSRDLALFPEAVLNAKAWFTVVSVDLEGVFVSFAADGPWVPRSNIDELSNMFDTTSFSFSITASVPFFQMLL